MWMWCCEQDKANKRRDDLEDSLQAQQYFADANEADSWMREKEPIVGNTDCGKDEDSAEVCGTYLGSIVLRCYVMSVVFHIMRHLHSQQYMLCYLCQVNELIGVCVCTVNRSIKPVTIYPKRVLKLHKFRVWRECSQGQSSHDPFKFFKKQVCGQGHVTPKNALSWVPSSSGM